MLPDISPELVSEARNGSEAAVGTIYKAIKRLGIPVAFRYLHVSGPDADEFAHDAATKVVMNIEKFKGDAKFTTWATTIVTNHALERLRRAKSTIKNGEMVYLDAPMSGEEGGKTYELASEADLEQEILAAVALGRIESAISRADWDLLCAVHLDGRTAEEMCRELAISLPALKSRLMRAREEAKKAFHGQIPASEEEVAVHHERNIKYCKCGCGTRLKFGNRRGYAPGHRPRIVKEPKEDTIMSATTIEAPARDRKVTISLELTEFQLDSLWRKLSLNDKALLMKQALLANGVLATR